MADTSLTSPYVQTASYFIFQSIITIISSFVSVGILTIHWIEHENHRFNEIDSPKNYNYNTKKRKKRRKRRLRHYTSFEMIISRLIWSTIIIFCLICIIFSIFFIFEQVARINEFYNILCAPWTVRILSSSFQFGVGLMHCLFMAELYLLYNEDEHIKYIISKYTFKPSIIKIFCLIIINITLLNCLLILIYVDVTPYTIYWLQQKHTACNWSAPRFLIAIVGLTEIIIFICTCYLYIDPMHKIIKLHKSSKNDMDFPSIFISKVNKITALTLIATITTFISAIIIGLSNAIWPSFIAMPINCICCVFMTNYYPNGYRKICCIIIRCRIRLFRKANKKHLQSELVYHVTMESAAIDLKGIDDDDNHKKETEAYLGKHDHLQLMNNNTYNDSVNPIGGTQHDIKTKTKIKQILINNNNNNNDNKYKIKLSDNSSTNLSMTSNRDRKSSKHKAANTMENMIMSDNTFRLTKTLNIENIDNENDKNMVYLNDTMISRSISDELSSIDKDKRNLLDYKPVINKDKTMSTTSSYQLSEEEIDNLMETVDNVEPFNNNQNNQNIEKQQEIDYQTSTEHSTRL